MFRFVAVGLLFIVLGVFLGALLFRAPATLTPGADDVRTFVIRNVDVVTMVPGDRQTHPRWSIYVNEGRIQYAGPSEGFESPTGVEIIDGAGRTVLPGLTDMHVHVWDEAELAAFLAHGVTTIRNMSGMPFHLRLQERRRAGQIIGPRVISTGPVLNGDGPNLQRLHQVIRTANEGRAAVRKQYKDGYRAVKVYSNLSRDAYEAILLEANDLGMAVLGHSPEGERKKGVSIKDNPFDVQFDELLDDGFVSFEHMETIVWHALLDDFDEGQARALARRIAQSGAAVTPSLIVHHSLVLLAETRGAYAERPEMKMLNPFIKDSQKNAYAYWASQPRGARSDYHAFYLRALKIFHEEGVPLITGTDAGVFATPPGASLADELALFVEAGLSPFEAIEAATVNTATALGLENEIGRIERGYRADFILVDGDPLSDISLVAHPSAVVVYGVLLDSKRLDALHETAENSSYLRTAWRVIRALWEQR